MTEAARPAAVAVVVPTFRRPERIERVVRALETQTLPLDRFEVIVVDDCSDDDTSERLAGLAASSPLALRVLQTPRNLGPAGARNLGWRSAHAPVAAFTDDDCIPEPGWLEAGLRLLDWDPAIGIAQGRTELPDGVQPSTAWEVYREIYRPTPWFEGCNLFLRRSALEAAGGFDESIGWFGEETALGWSVLAAGWDRGFADGAVVVHDVEDRGWRWHADQGRLEGNLVGLTRRFPAMRAELWRPWAVRRRTVWFLAAVAGLAVAPWRPAAAMAAVPYLSERGRDLLTGRGAIRTFAGRIAVDAAIARGMIESSVRERTLLL